VKRGGLLALNNGKHTKPTSEHRTFNIQSPSTHHLILLTVLFPHTTAKMQSTAALAFLALSALADATPSHSGLYRRSGCNYKPDMMNGKSYTTTPLFLLRIEEVSSNNTIGYVNAFNTDYAVISDRNASSPGFVAPYYNGYGSLIFWAGDNGTDRALNADDSHLSNSSSTLPVTTLISTQADGLPSCGTKPVYMQSKYCGTGSCVFGGEDVDVHFRCPMPGTVNDTPSPCWAQSYYGERACFVNDSIHNRLTTPVIQPA